ncbi:hypothetical protein B0T10DRAFT_588237 [Thelonectria olida]|uniref:Nephrocystin 3-like N-terminal domain-containing protein n=1 Tax=Thelonectria olida TaxID=1576542 RepID=A0A9P8VSP1_9HYPO|nr:hypothetical protein B0T10DRAFT_588237 [Thelonectria olida]
MEPSRPYIPNIHVQSPAVDFIDNRLDSYHPAFATPPSRYDPALGAYVVCYPPDSLSTPAATQVTEASTASPLPPGTEHGPVPPRPLAEPSTLLTFWDSLFAPAMHQLNKAHPTEPKKNVEGRFSIRDRKDCTGVFDQLDRAKSLYIDVNKGPKAKFRKVYRKVADNAIQPLIGAAKFVPNVDYVTPVLGAVQVLLEAAKTAAKTREDMLGAFDDLDMTFTQVELFLQLYSNDKNIQRASVDLIAAVFYAIECVIGFFIRASFKKAVSATFKGEEYQKDIIDSLSEVKSQSAKLIANAEMSEKHEISNAMRLVLNWTVAWKSNFEQIYREQKVILQSFRTGMMILLDECQSNRIAYKSLEDTIYASSRPSSPAPPDSVTVERHISPQELLELIDIPNLVVGDMEHIEQKRQTRVPVAERARAEHLVHTTQIKEWLVSPASSQILVHGNYGGRRQISGLTLFCTSLARSLAERAPRFLHLVFFCGLHDEPHADKYTGGRAMIQSFICQLLCQYDFGSVVRASEVNEYLLQLGEIDELCSLFEALVHRLPNSVVLVCLIDGIVYYEREEFMDSMADVLVTLLRISAEQTTQAAVKVLLTSPTKTMEVRQPFPQELILSMESMAWSGTAASKGKLERQLREQFYNAVQEKME